MLFATDTTATDVQLEVHHWHRQHDPFPLEYFHTCPKVMGKSLQPLPFFGWKTDSHHPEEVGHDFKPRRTKHEQQCWPRITLQPNST